MSTENKRGVLLVNLGSPDSPEIPDVKRYLDEFLMDERVIDAPYWLRTFIVRGLILPFRPKRSAAAYRSIWWDEGAPLIVISKNVLSSLKETAPYPAAIGMRYGNPSIEAGIRDLLQLNPNLEEFLLIPLYPHYAMSSYESVVVKSEDVVRDKFSHLKMHTYPPFFDDDDYNELLASSIKKHLDQIDEDYDHLLFSYHGLPERHLKKTDPTREYCLQAEDCCTVKSSVHKVCYRHQVISTTESVASLLDLPSEKYSLSFQSRLGQDKWLQPFTEQQLKEFPGKGIKKLVVVCPAFVSDCLETIEEIGEAGKETFLNAGGESYTLIPCLNDHPDWIKLLSKWITDYNWNSTN